MAPRLTVMPFPTDTFTNSTNITHDHITTHKEPTESTEPTELTELTEFTKPTGNYGPPTLEERRTPVEELRNHVEERRTLAEELRTPQKPQSNTPLVKLGYLGIHERPEELQPPIVYGRINGKMARIMLDSGCSTYVLSTDFAQKNQIPCYSCKPIPVELAVHNAGQFNLDTQTKKLPMEIGTINQSKALYVLPLPGCDAIFGMPFLNGRKLVTNPDQNTISIIYVLLPLA